MYIAVDENNVRIDIAAAKKGRQYFCPICHSPVIVRDGEINVKHFAHQAGFCTDSWNYDLSEWHRKMQEFFPPETREVMVTDGKRTHRADVLVGNAVIEFQHSPISAEEYADRTEFFMSLGYRIAWVFDVNAQCDSDNLYASDDNQWLMTWRNPFRMFSSGPFPNDQSHNFSIWLSWNDGISDYNTLYKVIWCVKDDEQRPSFKKIIISEHCINLNSAFDISEFFYSKLDHVRMAIQELKQKSRYQVKYIGKKGEPRQAYVCPRRNEFGLKLSSKEGCSYCRYCYMTVAKKRPDEKMWAIYCCYPNQVRDLNEGHPGYECASAPEFEI